MLIPLTLSPSSVGSPKLPPCLAKISHDEIVLIELQGSLEVESNHSSERDGKHVGKLKIDEATNKPTLTIGHHLLEGKIQALSKPLAVVVRSGKRTPPPSKQEIESRKDHDDDFENDVEMRMVVDGEDEGVPGPSRSEKTGVQDDNHQQPGSSASGEDSGLDASGTSWAIVAVVKKKIIFSKRPMPITTKATR